MTSSTYLLPLTVWAAAVVCAAQTSPTFSNKVSTPGARPTITLSADLNNDGFPDLIEDSAYAPIGFTIQLANGDGTFKAPVFHSVSGGNGSPAPMAVGDFNNDGKADVAAVLPGKNQVAVYLGNGDGTFQAPKYSTIALNSGQTFASAPVVAANFNGDGKVDLAVVGVAGNDQSVYVLQGDGAGGFNSPRDAINLPAYYLVQNMVTGDFDGDAKADLFFTGVFGCGTTGSCTTNVYGLFGDGNLGFEITTPYSSYNTFEISAGDLDSDGKSDLIGYDRATEQMIAFYGQADRTIASYSWTIPNVNGYFADGWTGPFQVGDFNGDGHMDIVGHFTNNVKDGTDYEFLIFLGTANRGQFTSYVQFLPASSMPVDIQGTAPVTVDENADGKPDIVAYQTPGPAATGPSDNAPLLVTAVNATASGNWGGCTYLNKAQGIRLCSPGSTSSSPVSFKASATSFGQLRKIELWVDGKKMAENFHAWEHDAWFNYTGTFPAGSHQATLYAADVDNRLQRMSYTFAVGSGGTCSAPSSYGVHVCSPANGATVSSPVSVQAAAKIAGTLARMEVWVDGVKKFTETTSPSFTTSISLAAGGHRFDVYAVNTAGTKYETTVNATVK
ncbi:FG-GAP-like repeat-containing protein [Occallatibacter riparius]|uniref:FG-GAP-like repeat-containing protein n=1 Tax=Occallatibacter riparius TaxID=1002689 RepID=A0A9J7BUJ1_9BACT|nr:FG-GAP-like repeat-containing protein [Occallatibacter riparius]UWZ86539.1 FG-GAP-like repeat-containing protein [Occallatibacter riparius]